MKRSYSSVGAEAHDVFDPGAVVPAAVEDHDLSRRRENADVALEKHWVFSRSEGAGRATVRKTRGLVRAVSPDRSALAGGIASFEHDNDPRPLARYPCLQTAKLDLELCAAPFR